MADTFQLSVIASGNLGGSPAASATYPFVILPDDLNGWIEARYPVKETMDFIDQDWAVLPPNQIRLGRPTPTTSVPVGVNECYHQPGNSGLTVFRGIMDRAAVAAVCTEVRAGRSLTLRMVSGQDPLATGVVWGKVDLVMRLLPPRPLVGRDDLADLFLVTLVDDGYFDRFRYDTANDVETDSAWANPALETVAAVYGLQCADSELYGNRNGNRWDIHWDAYYANVGRVFGDTRNTAYAPGAVTDWPRWSAVNSELLTVRETWKPYRQAGGIVSADPSVATDYRVPFVPRHFRVSFPKWLKAVGYIHPSEPPLYDRQWQPSSYPAVYVKTLDATADLSTPYSSWVYRDVTPVEAVQLNTTFRALYDATNPYPASLTDPMDTWPAPDNQAACDALAVQLAKDYLDANAVGLDEVYAGIVPFSFYANCHVHWSYSAATGPKTRVWRGPYLLNQTEFQHGAAGGDLNLPPVAFVNVTSGGASPYVGSVFGQTVWVRDKQAAFGTTLTVGRDYVGVLDFLRLTSGGTTRAVYDVHDPAEPLVVNTTPVSGGTANGVLYSDGSKLQSAANLQIVAGNVFVQAATNKWLSFSVGSH